MNNKDNKNKIKKSYIFMKENKMFKVCIWKVLNINGKLYFIF
jgi:hypothetical protein